MTRFQNPSNAYTVSMSTPVEFITCLAFGTIYFAYRGIWGHALLSLVAAVLTHGLSWLVYPFFVDKILKHHYQQRGWVALDG